MFKKGSLLSVAIIFIFLVVCCSPPDTGKKSSSNKPIEESPTNQAPIADAGIDRTILVTEAFAVDLDGSGSYDPDGNDLNYFWTSEDDTITFDPDNQSISPTVNLPTPLNQPTPPPGDYVFALVVDDGVNYSKPDIVIITVNNKPIEENPTNQAPIADAGIDRTILVTEAFAVDLDGSGSYDPDGNELNYFWTSEDDTITFDPDNQSMSPTVNLPTPLNQPTPTPGDYVFALVVDDGVNYSKPDIVIVTVVEPDAWVDSELQDDSPVEKMFKTIQNAIDYIDEISDGTEKIIVVINGPYNEKVTVKPKIHLIGLKPTNFETAEMPQIIYDNDLDHRSAVVSLQNNAVLENFEIACSACTYCADCDGDTTEKAAINIEGTNTEVKNCSIIGYDNSAYDGIWVKENMSATMTELVIKNVAGEGIQLEDGSSLVVENSLFFITGGSSIWARGWDRGINRVKVKNSISYHAGWHGFDFSGCNEVEVEHCTIVDFSWTDRCQSGIYIKCGNASLKSNLIEIRGTLDGIPTTTLRGVVYSEDDNPCTPENENLTCPSINITLLNNYIYTKQEMPIYYGGEIAAEPVDPSNYPTSNSGTSSDPKLMDPDARDFRLDNDSPAIGFGENNSNPGAEGAILNP